MRARWLRLVPLIIAASVVRAEPPVPVTPVLELPLIPTQLITVTPYLRDWAQKLEDGRRRATTLAERPDPADVPKTTEVTVVDCADPTCTAGDGSLRCSFLRSETAPTPQWDLIGCFGGSSGSGVPVILDLTDNGTHESSAIAEIATTGDVNGVISEPSADKVLIDLTKAWPTCDTADDLTCTGCIGATELDEVAIEAPLEALLDLQDLQGAVTDAQVPNSITVDLAATATALAANPVDCGASQFAMSIAASGDLTCAQPSFGDLAGTATDAQIPDTITVAVATTATALAADPADCGVNQYASSIGATGDLACAQVGFSQLSGSATDAQVPNSITVDLATAATALAANGANCGAGNYPLGVDASGAAESCTADDDVPESGDFGNLAGGAGVAVTSGTVATASGETDFLASGALTCGAGTRGRAQVHTTPLQYCDGSATPTLRYTAYGDSAGIATSAAALAANGANCAAGSAAGGVNASGAAEACLDPIEPAELDSSSELAGLLGDETGSGAAVFATSPTLITPAVTCTGCLTDTNVADIALGSGTGGNYVTSVSVASPIACSGCTAAEGGTPALSITADGITGAHIDEATLESGVGIGLPSGPALADLHVDRSTGQGSVLIGGHGDPADQNPVLFFNRSRGTFGSPTVPEAGDVLLTIGGRTYDGVDYENGGLHAVVAFECYATETHSSTAHGAMCKIFTTANGTSVFKNPLALNESGNVATPGILMGAIGDPQAPTHTYQAFMAPTGTPGTHGYREEGFAARIVETETTGNNPSQKHYQARALTSGAGAIGLAFQTTTTGEGYVATAKVKGICTGGSACSVGDMLGCEVKAVVQNPSGTASIVGALEYPLCQAGLGTGAGGIDSNAECKTACTIAAGASCGASALLCVIVAGLADQNITWQLIDFEVGT